ncbi:MAG: hypothetical protein DYG91_14435 [Chloroflexi bacterium CFX7]|nr:hypothetical protein [Chloroflexi bacterium CFX7]
MGQLHLPIGVCLALAVSASAVASAQTPAAPPPPPAADAPPPAPAVPSYPAPGPATNNWDVLVTADGRVLYVRVMRHEPGSFVTFRHSDGREETWAWAQVKVVALVPDRTGLVTPGAPVPPPTKTSQTNVGTSGVQHSTARDCSTRPGEQCQEQTTTNVDGRGVSFGLQGQSVQRVVTPPSYDIGGAVELAGLYGTGTGDIDVTILGYNVQGGLRTMFGGQFPGPEGGGWSGVGLELMGTFGGGAGKIDAAGTEVDYEQATVSANVGAGYQYLKFGSMDPKTLQQGGFGLFLGYRVGAAANFTTTKVGDKETTNDDTSMSHGPVLTLSFPKYNAGTAKLRRWTITAMGMYISDFLLVTVGGGYTW